MTAYRGAVSASAVANTDDGLTIGATSPVAQVGDLLLATVMGATSVAPSYFVPPGWNAVPNVSVYDSGSPGVGLALFFKRATAGDLGDNTFGWDPAHGAIVAITAYSPSAAGREVRLVETLSAAATASSATRTTPSLTTNGPRWLVSIYADRSGSTWTIPTGQTQRHAVSRGSGAASLLVTDSNGDVAAGTYSRTVTASAASGTRVEAIVAMADVPAAPVITPPADRVLEPFEAVTLTATTTDGTVSWSQVSGPTVTLTGASAGRITLTGPATMDGGTVVLRASATANGVTATADVTLTVPPHTVWAAAGGVWRAVQIVYSAADVDDSDTPPLPDAPPPVLWMSDYDTATTRTTHAAAVGAQQTWAPEDSWQTVQYPGVGGYPSSTNGIAPESSRMTVVDGPSVPGTGAWKPAGRALRVEIRPYNNGTGDVGQNDASRTEAYARHAVPGSSTPAASWPDPPGAVRWWGWSLLFPTDHVFATDSTWMTLLQVKGYRGGSPPVAIEVNRQRLRLTAGGSSIDLGSIAPGQWTHIALGALLSTSSTDGWVELWRDGAQVVARRAAATLDVVNGAPDPIYTKQGIYRSKNWTSPAVVWHGPLRLGIDRDAVTVGGSQADTTAPTTTLTSPSAGSTTDRSVTAGGAYTDA